MIILGLDPGIATTGFGIIKKIKNEHKVLDYGCISTDSSSKPGDRLKKIHLEITKLIKKHKPNVLAVESLFFFKNLKTALPVSQAKGVILLAASQQKIPLYEFTPLQMKMAVTGYGKAEKKQVQKMIQVLLNLKEMPKIDDAADALGIALCYIIKTSQKIKLD